MKQIGIQIGPENKLLNIIGFSNTEIRDRVSRLMKVISRLMKVISRLMRNSENYQLSIEPDYSTTGTD